jgi:hypothetical protein
LKRKIPRTSATIAPTTPPPIAAALGPFGPFAAAEAEVLEGAPVLEVIDGEGARENWVVHWLLFKL